MGAFEARAPTMTHDVRRLAVTVVVLSLAMWRAAGVHASQDDLLRPPSDQTRFALNPTVTLSDVGLDTNILATPHGEMRDTTANLAVEVQPVVPLGRVRLTGKAGVRAAYFQQYVHERSLDTNDNVKVEVRGRRAAAYTFGSFLRTREPFDPEFYVRTLRTEQSFEGGGEFRLTGVTRIAAIARRNHVDVEAMATGVDGRAGESLTRQTDSFAVSLKNAVTPYTTLVVTGRLQRDRFDFTAMPEAIGIGITTGVEIDPRAMIAGTAYVGYRRFGSPANAASNVGHFVGAIDIGSTLGTSLRYSVRLERDLGQSFRLIEPYFLSMDVSGTVTKRVSRTLDITATAGRQWVDYDRQVLLVTPAIEQAARDAGASLDDLYRYGAGAIFRIRRNLSIGATAEYYRFHSRFVDQTYERLRLVSSLTSRF
jgi:hypothetical protein